MMLQPDWLDAAAGRAAVDLLLKNARLINVFSGTLTNSGTMTGSGGVTKGQSGTLIYAGGGANSYNGDTVVNTGTLLLAKTIATAGIVNGALTRTENDLDTVTPVASVAVRVNA